MNDNTCETIPAKADAIKRSPLGSELDDAQCDLLADVMTSCAIKDRTFLIEEGQKDDCLHVLTCGNMEVVTQTGGGDQVGLQILREGDILGELGFLDGIEHSASLRAMGNCNLLRLERTSLEALVYKVMRAIVRTVHRILRNMNIQQVELTNYITRQNGRY